MRVFTHAAAIGVGVSVLCGIVSVGAQGPAKKDAATILAQTREALGGEKRLSGVKNFVATGRTRQVRGENLVPIEFEIACELPDKYVRKDEIPAQESGPTSTGFNGDDLILLPIPVAPPPGAAGAQPGRGGAAPEPQRGGGGPPAAAGRGEPGAPAGPARGGEGGGRAAGPMGPAMNPRVAATKQDFVRLTLGMFAGSFSTYPLTFNYVGQAEAPQGSADVLEVKGPANFSAQLFVNSQTHLPIMISWKGPAGRGRGPAPGGPPAGAAAAAPGAPPTPPAPVEYRIYYADYRDVDGMQWPFRLRRATGADTTEETTFDRFRVNTKIDPKKFEVHK